MSNTLNIKINIREIGLEVFDNIKNKVVEVQEAMSKEISFPNIRDSLKAVNTEMKSEAVIIKDSSSKIMEETAATAVKSVEQFYSAIGIGVSALIHGKATAISEFFFNVTDSIIVANDSALAFKFISEGLNSAFLGLGANLKGFLGYTLALSNNMISIGNEMGLIIYHATSAIPLIGEFSHFFASIASIAGLVGKGTVLSLSFMLFTNFLKESEVLLRRILGLGSEANTPLKSGVSLIQTFNGALTETQLTVGQIFKTVTFTVAAFTSPAMSLIAGVPAINGIIDSVLRLGSRFRLSFLSFFGSAKGQISLIVLTVRNAFEQALPMVNKIGNSFGNIQKRSELAGKSFQNALPNNVLRNVSNLRLPFAVQFQSFSHDFRNLISFGLKKITELTTTMQLALGMSKKEIMSIRSIANNSLNQASEKTRHNLNLISDVATNSRKAFGFLPKIFGKTNNHIRKISKDIKDKKIFGVTFRRGFEVAAKTKAESLVAPRLGISGQNSTKSVKLIADQKKAIVDLSTTINNLNIAISSGFKKKHADIVETTKAFENFSTVAVKSAKKVNAAIPSTIKKTGVRQNVGDFLKKGFNFNTVADRDASIFSRSKSAGLAKIRGGGANNLSTSGFLTSLSTGLESGKLEAVYKSLTKFSGALATMASNINSKSFSSNEFMKFIDSFAKVEKINKVDISKLRKLFAELKESVKGFEGKNIGDKFVKSISVGVEENSGKAAKSMEIFTKMLMEFFPQSPAKRGALTKLPKVGLQINKQIATGMIRNIKIVNAAAKRIAEQIAGFFPQSPARFAPLSGLTRAGSQIPTFIADGMMKTILKVKSVSQTIANFIFAPLDEAILNRRIARQVGIAVEQFSALESSFKVIGVNGQELVFVLNRINRIIKGNATEETKNFLSGLGVSLEEIRKQAQPNIALFLQMSDALKNVGSGSKEQQKLLEILSVTAQSGAFDLMIRGSKEISQALNDISGVGAFFDETFSKASEGIGKVLNLLKEARKFFFVEVLRKTLPEVERILNNIKASALANNTIIRAYFSKVSEFLAISMVMIEKTFIFAKNEPVKALGLALEISKKTIMFLFEIFTGAISGINKTILISFKNLSFAILSIGASVLLVFAREVDNFVDNRLESITAKIKDAWIIISEIIKAPFTLLFNALEEMERSRNQAGNIFKNFSGTSRMTFTDEQFLKGAVKNPELSESNRLKKEVEERQKNIEIGIKDISQGINEVIEEFSDFGNIFLKEFDFAGVEKKLKSSLKTIKKEILGTANEIGLSEELKKIDNLFSIDIKKTMEEVKKAKSILMEGLQSASNFAENNNIFGDEKNDDNNDEVKKAFTFQEFIAGNTFKAIQKGISATGDAFSKMYELSGKQAKELFLVKQAAAIATAIVNTSVAVTEALKMGAAGIAIAPIVSAAGLAEVATIVAQTVQGFADGGMITGGIKGKDSVLIKAMPGELVVNKNGVDRLRSQYGNGFLQNLINGRISKEFVSGFNMNHKKAISGGIQTFSNGGVVLPQSSTDQKQDIKINMASFMDKKEFRDYLLSSEANNIILNVFRKNQHYVKKIMR